MACSVLSRLSVCTFDTFLTLTVAEYQGHLTIWHTLWLYAGHSENFTYLGSVLSFSGDLTNGIQRRINLASSAIGRLGKRVFGNQDLTIHTEIAVYDAVVISTILFD